MTIKPGYTKVRAYMWIEGQDMDCYTGASGTYLDFNLKFEVDTVTGAQNFNNINKVKEAYMPLLLCPRQS